MHPIAFELGRLTITWYGVMVMLGFVAGMWTASRRGLLRGVDPERTFDLGPWLILGAVLGARALYVATFWREDFAGRSLAAVFMVWHGGLVYYGGLVGASLGCVLYTRIKKVPLWSTADILAPSIALGQASADRVPAQRLLLRARLLVTLGHSLSRRQRRPGSNLSGASHRDL